MCRRLTMTRISAINDQIHCGNCANSLYYEFLKRIVHRRLHKRFSQYKPIMLERDTVKMIWHYVENCEHKWIFEVAWYTANNLWIFVDFWLIFAKVKIVYIFRKHTLKLY